MASLPAAETPAANAAPAAATPPTPAVTVGFQTKTSASTQAVNALSSTANVTPERMAYLEATLAKLPELDLSEMARVKTCFASVLGDGRENIVNSLELRVVLGDLGLYPNEEEMKLVLRAYRDRVNLVGLARYLRLYKKEFWLNQVAARSSALQKYQQQQQNLVLPGAVNTSNNAPGNNNTKKQLVGLGGINGTSNNPNAVAGGNAMPHTYTAFSGSHAHPGGAAGGNDEDTLRAFVALGGEEDGSGEISAATLRDAVRGFGLTIDIDAMIRTVDVHHSGMLDYVDFCALWAAPADGGQSTDAMGHALRLASADAERRGSINSNNNVLDNNPFLMNGASRRLLSALLTPSHRSSLTPGTLRRRSYLMNNGYDMPGLSQPITPRVTGSGTPGAGRPPISGGEGTGENTATGMGGVSIHAPVITAAVPAPITEEEHALLVRMFFFPEQFESLSSNNQRAATASSSTGADSSGGGGRRGGARFMIPPRTAQATSPSHAGNAMNGQSGGAAAGAPPGSSIAITAASGRRASLSQRSQSQKQLSRFGQSAKGNSRSRSQNRRGRKSNNNNTGSGDGDDSDDLTADFFSPKNQNVYRPPSPMLLSMRNNRAYRNRVKQLEEQRHAARGTGGGNTNTYQQQQGGGMHVAAVSRDGYGADGDSASRPAKSMTW